jgi:hypothetical protein
MRVFFLAAAPIYRPFQRDLCGLSYRKVRVGNTAVLIYSVSHQSAQIP